MDNWSKKIDSVIEERKEIYDAVNRLAAVQEKALLESNGVMCSDSDFSSSDSEPEEVVENQVAPESNSRDWKEVLQQCQFNYNIEINVNEIDIPSSLTDEKEFLLKQSRSAYFTIPSSLTDKQEFLLKQSRSAYFTIDNEVVPIIERELAGEKGGIVSESDEEHPDNYLDVQKNLMKLKLWFKKRLL